MPCCGPRAEGNHENQIAIIARIAVIESQQGLLSLRFPNRFRGFGGISDSEIKNIRPRVVAADVERHHFPINFFQIEFGRQDCLTNLPAGAY